MNGVFSWFLMLRIFRPFVPIDHRDLAILQVDHVLGVLHDRRGIAGTEDAPRSPRCRSPRASSCGRPPSHPAPCGPGPRWRTPRPHSPAPGERPRQVHLLGALDVVDQMHQHLGVRIALEHMAAMLQLLLDGRIVLDDPVVDQGEIAAGARCGWAFTSLGGPCVAQRVWPIPDVPFSGPYPLTWASRSLTLPWHL
jgi:hypothetical protein